jgi:hypothetical protein
MDKELVDHVRSTARLNQYDISKMNSSHTKLGPTHHHHSGLFSASSWVKPVPLPESYAKRMMALGEKYQNLRWLPLDIPVIDFEHKEEFLEIWNKEKIALLPTDGSIADPEFYGMHIHSNCLLDFQYHDTYSQKINVQHISEESGMLQGRQPIGLYTKKLFRHRFFSRIIDQILCTYPINLLSNIMILETARNVAPHREETWAWKCPTELRSLLFENKPKIYVADIEHGDINYVNMPADTNTVCWSNGTQIYGIDYNNEPSFQIVVNAVWDYKKIDHLLETSISKYKSILNYKLEI